MTLSDIDSMGQKTITGKVAITKEDYSQLTSLAKEGITSRNEIHNLREKRPLLPPAVFQGFIGAGEGAGTL